jgi:hypothetical protein
MKRILASSMVLAAALAVLSMWGVETRAADPPGARPTVPTAGESASPNDGTLDLYFIGNRRGQIEPCGCQTKQRGGMQYEAALYHQHDDRPALRLDAGGWMRSRPDRGQAEALKIGYILRAMRAIDFDAINVGITDIVIDKPYYDNLHTEHPEVYESLVSANIFTREDPARLAFAPYRIVERRAADGGDVRIGIVGATTAKIDNFSGATEESDFTVKDPVDALRSAIAELRPKVDLLVVLYASAYREDLQSVVGSVQEADLIVTSVPNRDPRSMLLRDGNIYVAHTPSSLGKELGVVSLKRSEEGKWIPAADAESLYVSLDRKIDPAVNELIEEYKGKTSLLAVEIPPAHQINEIYAGKDSCRTCHAAIYESWSATPHAHALDQLVNKNQQFNPECVQCHVTGYRTENGFYTLSNPSSLRMMHVQCEVCHGPARRHMSLEQQILSGARRWKTQDEYDLLLAEAKKHVPPKAVPAETCTQCHQGENDPHFDYEKMIQLVNHGDVSAEDRALTPTRPVFAPKTP